MAIIPPDNPGDHGKGALSGEVCCDDTNNLLTDILNALGGGSVKREIDGDIQVGVGTIIIPDGVLSFSLTVLVGGSNPDDLTDWVTIDGPDFAAPVPLIEGQSVSQSGDSSNTISGPITITVPANAAVNATWMMV